MHTRHETLTLHSPRECQSGMVWMRVKVSSEQNLLLLCCQDFISRRVPRSVQLALGSMSIAKSDKNNSTANFKLLSCLVCPTKPQGAQQGLPHLSSQPVMASTSTFPPRSTYAQASKLPDRTALSNNPPPFGSSSLARRPDQQSQPYSQPAPPPHGRQQQQQHQQQTQQEKESNPLNELSEEQREEIDEAVRFEADLYFILSTLQGFN